MTNPLIPLFRTIVLSIAVSPALFAQDLGMKPPATQQKPVLIEGATIHTISGETFSPGHVVFIEGKIRAIGAGAGPRVDSAMEIIKAEGMHVYPGLIGANTQTGLLEIGAARATLDYAETGSITPEVRAAVAVNPDSTIIPVTRSNGVLSVGVLPMGGAIPGRAAVMNLEGWTWEEMTVEGDAGVVVNWPNMRPQRGWWVTRSVEEQEKERRTNLDAIDQAFLAARAYYAAKSADPALPTDLRWEAMRGTLEQGDPVFIRADELEQIQSAVSWAVERGIKPVIVGGRDAGHPAAIEQLKRHDAAVIIAGTFRLPRRADSVYDESYTLPARLEEAGVRWCLATVGGPFETPHERNLPYQAGLAVAFGLSPDAALKSITIHAANIMGVGSRLGSLEVGKDATLIITTGNPLEVATRVERAFILGREIDLTNKQRILDKKYREKYRQLGITE